MREDKPVILSGAAAKPSSGVVAALKAVPSRDLSHEASAQLTQMIEICNHLDDADKASRLFAYQRLFTGLQKLRGSAAVSRAKFRVLDALSEIHSAICAEKLDRDVVRWRSADGVLRTERLCVARKRGAKV